MHLQDNFCKLAYSFIYVNYYDDSFTLFLSHTHSFLKTCVNSADDCHRLLDYVFMHLYGAWRRTPLYILSMLLLPSTFVFLFRRWSQPPGHCCGCKSHMVGPASTEGPRGNHFRWYKSYIFWTCMFLIVVESKRLHSLRFSPSSSLFPSVWMLLWWWETHTWSWPEPTNWPS